MIGQNEQHLKNRWLEYWNQENHDRPLLSIEVPLAPTCPAPEKPQDLQQRWEDPAYVVAAARWRMEHTWYGGEAFPALSPDIGPNLIGSMGGCKITYGESTVWAEPVVEDWESYPPCALMRKAPGGRKFAP